MKLLLDALSAPSQCPTLLQAYITWVCLALTTVCGLWVVLVSASTGLETARPQIDAKSNAKLVSDRRIAALKK